MKIFMILSQKCFEKFNQGYDLICELNENCLINLLNKEFFVGGEVPGINRLKKVSVKKIYL